MTKEGINKILSTLEESLNVLNELSRISQKEFMKSKEIQDRVKWNFYVVIQACLDLGNHIISVKRLELPDRYEGIIYILEKAGIIPHRIAKSLQGMGGFRNLIAHGYFRIDLEKMYNYLKKLDDIKAFLKALEPYSGK